MGKVKYPTTTARRLSERKPPKRRMRELFRLARVLPPLRGKRVFGEAPIPLRRRGIPPWQPWPYIEERLLQLAELAGPAGTLPERLFRLYLIIRQIPFEEQTIFGSPLRLGGAIVDFFLPTIGARGTIVRIQGDYWHTLFPRIGRDRMQYERLIREHDVLDVWESDLREAAAYGMNGLIAFGDRLLSGL
jgi:hypothetical protein